MIRLQNIDANIKPSRTFGRGKYLIGRSPSCDLEIPDRTMSRQHAMLEVVDDERIYLTDLDSRNGTMVNGERIMNTVRLKPEDIVAFGEVSFSVSPVDDDTFRGDTVPIGGKSGESDANAEIGVETGEIRIISKELPLVDALEFLGQVLVDPANEERVYGELLKGVRLAITSDEVSVLIWDRANSRISKSYSLNRELMVSDSKIPVSEQVISSTIKSHSVARVSASPKAEPGDPSSVFLAVRLDFNDVVFGVLCIRRYSARDAEPNQVFRDVNDRTVMSLVHVAASKIANLQFLQKRG